MSAADQNPFTQELPVFVRLRSNRFAVVEQLRAEADEYPLCGRFILGTGNSRSIGASPISLWRADGTFATDHAEHELDIVAEIMPDLSERSLAVGGVA